MAASFGGQLGNYAVDPNPGGTSFTITTAGTVASDGRLVLETGFFGIGASTISVSGGGLTWTRHTSSPISQSSSIWGVAVFSAPAPSGLASGTVITVTFSGSVTYFHGSCIWFADAATHTVSVTPVGIAQATLNGSFQWNPGTLTPDAAGFLYAACVRSQAPQAGTPNAGYSEAYDYVEGSSNSAHHSVYRLNVTATAYSDIGGAFTSTTGEYWAMAVAFAEPAGAAAVPLVTPAFQAIPFMGARP